MSGLANAKSAMWCAVEVIFVAKKKTGAEPPAPDEEHAAAVIRTTAGSPWTHCKRFATSHAREFGHAVARVRASRRADNMTPLPRSSGIMTGRCRPRRDPRAVRTERFRVVTDSQDRARPTVLQLQLLGSTHGIWKRVHRFFSSEKKTERANIDRIKDATRTFTGEGGWGGGQVNIEKSFLWTIWIWS